MNRDVRNATITEYLKALRLPTIRRKFEATARRARDGQWDYEDFLHELLAEEVRHRRDRSVANRLKAAKFPDIKTLEQLEWSELKGVKKPKIMELAACDYIDAAESVVIAGPIGTGKTHLAIALGVEAARQRRHVAFARAADLVRDLVEARDEHTLGRLQKRYRKVALLIIDELGFVPFERHESELLFNLLADRYEKAATLITTNLSFGEWVQVFGSEKLTTALLDRLTHRSHILTTKGDSYRTKRLRQRHTTITEEEE